MKYKYPFNAKLSVIEVLVLSCKPGQRRRLGWFCRPSSLRRTECYHRWESGRHRELRALISGTVVRTKPLCSAPSVKEMDWGKPVWRTRVPSTGRLVSLNCCRPQRQPISSQPLSCLTGLKGILQPYKTDPLQQNIRTTLTFICDQNRESVSDSRNTSEMISTSFSAAAWTEGDVSLRRHHEADMKDWLLITHLILGY